MTVAGSRLGERGKIALVVDDDEAMREAVCALLRDEGITAVGATNGLAALRYLATNAEPAFIVLDLEMPQLSGWGVQAHLNANPRLRRIPLLILSGHVKAGVHAGPHGVTYLLAKPLRAAELLVYVRRFVHRQN